MLLLGPNRWLSQERLTRLGKPFPAHQASRFAQACVLLYSSLPSPSLSTAMNASCGTSTLPSAFMRFLPSACWVLGSCVGVRGRLCGAGGCWRCVRACEWFNKGGGGLRGQVKKGAATVAVCHSTCWAQCSPPPSHREVKSAAGNTSIRTTVPLKVQAALCAQKPSCNGMTRRYHLQATPPTSYRSSGRYHKVKLLLSPRSEPTCFWSSFFLRLMSPP
jgi:hypothetical protein